MGTNKKKVTAEQQETNKRKHTSRQIDAGMREFLVSAVAELYIKGYSYRKIVKQIQETKGETISIVTVGNYIKRLLAEWKAHRIDALDDLKSVELQRINRLETTYWEGWERSMDGSKRSSEKQKAAPKKAISPDGSMVDTMTVLHAEKSSTTEDTFGDPRFLAGIQWCISMRCKILGIEAPIEFKGHVSSEIKRVTVFKTHSRNRPAAQ